MNKHYFEEYARLTICDIFPERTNHMLLGERPDIQDVTYKVGIEVTRAALPFCEKREAFIQKFISKKLTRREKKFLIKKYEGLVLFKDREIFAHSQCKGLIDTADYLNAIKKAIITKGESFKKEGYTRFKNNELYIFSRSFIHEWDIKQIMLGVDPHPFDLIYINCIDHILIWSINGIKEYKISDNRLAFYKETALEKFPETDRLLLK